MSVGIFTTLVVVLVGSAVGALAGFFGGFFDALLSRVTDIFFAVPFVLAAIVVMQMFRNDRSILTVILGPGPVRLAQIARITRGSVMSVKTRTT